MTSIYRRALGDDFERLHPQIQRRFGFSSEDGVASIGRGVMEEIWRGPAFTVPFLVLGTWRRIMFPDRARDVPFTIENYAYVDRFGRETVTWNRTFQLAKVRRFDATFIYSESRGGLVVSAEVAAIDDAVARTMLQGNAPAPSGGVRRRACVGNRVVRSLARHRQSAIAREPMGPVVETSLESALDQQGAQTRTVDEEIARDHLVTMSLE